MKSVMNAHFTQVPKADIPRSSFQRDFGYKTAIDFDYLYPIMCEEMLPADTATVNLNVMARLATPLFPIMDNAFIDVFYFSIPYRLVWENFRRFQGEQDNPGDTIDYLIPEMASPDITGYAEDSIHDYMDIPPGVPNLLHSVLWHRAYNLVWNEWFKDENIQDAVTVNLGDGPDLPTDYTLLKRGKRLDYFTSCLPFAQKDYGNPVLLPLGDSAPVIGTAPVYATSGNGNPLAILNGSTSSVYETMGTNATTLSQSASAGSIGQGMSATADNAASSLTADLSTATAATINQLRLAFQIQKMYERDARGGSRYVEIVKSHFGVTTPSAGWRTEYLGGGSNPISITQVAQTARDPIAPDDSSVGDLSAYGTARFSGNGFTKSFTEHCLVLGLVAARSDLNYQQGLPRKFSRRTRFDHYFPALSHIGEQAVLQGEIFAQGDPLLDDIVFGYQERWAEMRYSKSAITGAMRSTHSLSLDPWHLAQDFATAPTLSSEFIEQNTPVDRVIAVPSEKHLIFDSFTQFRHARPMPTYSTPGLIDHF